MAAQKLFSFSSQNTTVDGVLTGYENLHLIAKLRHKLNPKKVAEGLLDKFDLTEAKDKAVSTYSGGMRRRLDLAMSLVGDPEIIFLDEPTTGLDLKSRQELWNTIKETYPLYKGNLVANHGNMQYLKVLFLWVIF